MTEERTIAVTTHGRYLVHPPDSPSVDAPILVGFHGYAEDAELQLERLRSIPATDRWVKVSVQGLHRFYRGRSSDVVASWMTRQNRELMIDDNLRYVDAVVEQVRRHWSLDGALVFAGFSQGVAMTFRTATLGSHAVRGVISLGGDVPPELGSPSLARIPEALLGRGERDEWYTPEKLSADEARLRTAGTNVIVTGFDAGHEWTADFSRVVAAFLARVS